MKMKFTNIEIWHLGGKIYIAFIKMYIICVYLLCYANLNADIYK